MAQILNDTFTDTNGVAITAHTPDSGGSWSLHTGTNGTIQSNRARAGAGFGYWFHSVAATANGEEITGVADLVSSGTTVGLMLRCNPASGGSFYMALWDPASGGAISLWRKVNGTLTQIKTGASFTATGNHTLQFLVSGQGAAVSLELKIDGVSRDTYSDTAANRITALGTAGMEMSGQGYQWTSLTATDSASAGATATTLSGPSSGAVGVASTNFTVGANGAITGTVTVTPADGGAGGAFTPASVAISSGTPTAAFTYTPASSGAKTISISDDGGLTDATPLTYTATSTNAITITTPADGRIHQRSGTTGTITVTGTYTGTPTTIEARLVQDGTSTPLASFDWATKVASPAGGAYSFSFAGVPQGGWYNVQVRFSNDTPTSATSGKVGVGVLIGMVGQSNSWYMVRTFGTATDPNALVRIYGNINTNTWTVPAKATMAGAIGLGNALASALSIPVGLLDFAANSGALSAHWIPVTLTTNRTFTNGVAALDGKLEAIAWTQGEGDADIPRTQAQYYADLGTLFADWRSEFGQPNLPIVLSTIGRATSGLYTDEESQAIFRAQVQKIADANVYRVDRKDLAISDTVHHTAAGYETLGGRIARAVLKAIGAVSTYRGPQISEVRRINSTTFDVVLTHDNGTDFTPTSGISGFRVLDGGTPVTINNAIRTSATRIRLTLASAPASLPTVQYLYGNNPDVAGVVKDNSALALPLEANDGVVALAARTATVQLVDTSNAPRASLTGLKWAWFDEVTPDLFNAPTDKGTGEVTDGSGVLVVDLPNTLKSSGQVGWLIVTNSDGTTTQSPAHKAFSGPVAVD